MTPLKRSLDRVHAFATTRPNSFAALLGALAATGHAPLSLWPLTCLAFIAVFWRFQFSASPKAAMMLGWSFGTGYFAVSLNWIIEPFLVDIALHGWMAPFALILMAGGLSIFWAFAFYAGHRLKSVIALAGFWGLAEFARGTVLTGFPWALPAYVLIETPAVQIAAFVGSYGLTTVFFLLAAASIKLGSRKGALFYVISLSLLMGAGAMRLTRTPALAESAPTVRLVQPNAAQREKWDPEMIPVFFDRQIKATQAFPRPDLIIWPETSLQTLMNFAAPSLDIMADAAAGVPLIFGTQREDNYDYFNSLAVLNADGVLEETYDKHHLVPFGEYIPLAQYFSGLPISALADLSGSGFVAGTGPQIIDLGQLGTILPLICYEAVFPRDVRSQTVRPDYLVHITNDAWFGKWSGPYQHLVQAQMRAIEQGLPLLRAANTGVSAVIDASGRIMASLPLNTQGYLDAAMPTARAETFYARFGNIFAIITAFLCIFAAILSQPRIRN